MVVQATRELPVLGGACIFELVTSTTAPAVDGGQSLVPLIMEIGGNDRAYLIEVRGPDHGLRLVDGWIPGGPAIGTGITWVAPGIANLSASGGGVPTAKVESIPQARKTRVSK
jgi:hypothetical protein